MSLQISYVEVPWIIHPVVIHEIPLLSAVDREGYRASRRCSRDTYLESYITKYTNIRRLVGGSKRVSIFPRYRESVPRRDRI